MTARIMKLIPIVALAIVGAGCASSSSTPQWGYAGPPPLFVSGDWYIEHQSLTGPPPTEAMGPPPPGTQRYWWIAGSPEWYTFTGAQGAVGKQGPQGPQGLAGTAGPAGAKGAMGPQGVVGPVGEAGPAGRWIVETR